MKKRSVEKSSGSDTKRRKEDSRQGYVSRTSDDRRSTDDDRRSFRETEARSDSVNIYGSPIQRQLGVSYGNVRGSTNNTSPVKTNKNSALPPPPEIVRIFERVANMNFVLNIFYFELQSRCWL